MRNTDRQTEISCWITCLAGWHSRNQTVVHLHSEHKYRFSFVDSVYSRASENNSSWKKWYHSCLLGSVMKMCSTYRASISSLIFWSAGNGFSSELCDWQKCCSLVLSKSEIAAFHLLTFEFCHWSYLDRFDALGISPFTFSLSPSVSLYLPLSHKVGTSAFFTHCTYWLPWNQFHTINWKLQSSVVASELPTISTARWTNVKW